MGVLEVRTPDGRRWWVKRAWVPRYRTLRERVALHYAQRDPHWYDAPLRWAAGPPRYTDVVPTGSPLRVGSRPGPERHDRSDVPDVPDPGLVDVVPVQALDLPVDAVQVLGTLIDGDGDGAGAAAETAARLLDVGGGSSLPADLGGLDVGGGSTIAGDLPSGGGGSLDSGGGSGGGGGGGMDGDGPEILVVLAVIIAAFLAVALLWFVVVPFLLLFVDATLLLALVLAAGLVRVLFRRPWDVVAVEDLEDGSRRIRRWEVRGYRRAGRVRDDVARALTTGTDPDLAVVRVLVREPRDDDPAGAARSVTEIEGDHAHPSAAVVEAVPGPLRWRRRWDRTKKPVNRGKTLPRKR